jgi:spore maturation protein CgeB
MEMYSAAMYQQDVINEFKQQTIVECYGPGFPNFNPNDTLNQVLTKLGSDLDLIVIGHAWLNDTEGRVVDPQSRIKLNQTTLPKFAILNKEYTNLTAKLNYFIQAGVDVIFSHHHEIDRYRSATGIECVFWPFAFDGRRHRESRGDKTIDLAFSGILQNQNQLAIQSDIRVRIMKNIFHCIGDVPLRKKSAYKHLEIVFNSISRSRPSYYLAAVLRKRRYLDIEQYLTLQQSAKVFLNTLSPLGLVSPRYFESMASKSVVLCESSDIYKNIFPEGVMVSFNPDLSDFEERLISLLAAPEELKNISARAYELVVKEHTWECRINSFIQKYTLNRCGSL